MTSFYDYLEAYARADSEADRAGIENDLWEEFGVEEAVFVLDMVGFTRISQDRGLVHYLSMIQRMRMTIRPMENCWPSLMVITRRTIPGVSL